MTLEQEYDLHALTFISENPNIGMPKIVEHMKTIVGNDKSAPLHKQYLDDSLIWYNTVGTDNLYYLTDGGKIALSNLKIEKQKETLDLKLKEITIDSLRWNKYFPFLALIVALLAIAVPAYFKYEENKSNALTISPTKIKELIQELKMNSKPAPKTLGVLVALDSLNK